MTAQTAHAAQTAHVKGRVSGGTIFVDVCLREDEGLGHYGKFISEWVTQRFDADTDVRDIEAEILELTGADEIQWEDDSI